MFLIVTVVLTVWPGTIVVEPPYLLIVAQVNVLLVTLLPVPSVLLHVTVPAAFCSCMITVPAAAVLIEFVIEAVNAARLEVIDRARIATPTRPVRIAASDSRRRAANEEAGEGIDTGRGSWPRELPSGCWAPDGRAAEPYDNEISHA